MKVTEAAVTTIDGEAPTPDKGSSTLHIVAVLGRLARRITTIPCDGARLTVWRTEVFARWIDGGKPE